MKTKLALLLLAALVSACSQGTSTPGTAGAGTAAPFAAAAAGPMTQEFQSVAALPDGSTLVSGIYAGDATFSQMVSLTAPAGEFHGMVVRYDKTGSAVGSEEVAGQNVRVSALAAAPDGSYYACGSSRGGATTVSPGSADEVDLPAVGSSSCFIARFAADGRLLWARRDGGGDQTEIRSAALLPDGSCVVCGSFLGTAVFGQGEPSETTATSTPDRSTFLAEYTKDGKLAWAKFEISTAYSFPSTVAVLTDGTVVATGHFGGTTTFGAGEGNETALTTTGDDDAFLVHLDPSDGSLLWVRVVGGPGRERGIGVCGLADGSIALCGTFIGTDVTFETSGRTVHRAGTGEGLWLGRFLVDGTLDWTTQVESDQFLNGGLLAPMPDGGFAMTCSGPGTTTFSPGAAMPVSFTSPNAIEILTARFHADGTLSWARADGGMMADQTQAIAPGPAASILLAGIYVPPMALGPFSLPANDNRQHGFVSRLNGDGTY